MVHPVSRHFLPLLSTLDAWDRLVEALAVHDAGSVHDLICDGRLRHLEADATLEVEGDHATLLSVHVLDGIHAGMRGLVPFALLPRTINLRQAA